MLSTYRRHGVVVLLALAASLASRGLAQPQSRDAALPAIAGLTSGTGWQVVATYNTVAGPGMAWGQWGLRNAQGARLALYLGVTDAVQKLVHWSGELAYEGAGYQVLWRRPATIRIHGGVTAPISVILVQHLGDRELLAYAVASPDGISARSTDDPLRTAWDALLGTTGPYYLVRVSVPVRQVAGRPDAGASALAVHLLAPVLSTLYADARASGR
jgi:hypothetical protein